MAPPAQALATAPIPPQNLDAEESVLGAMMLNALAIGAVTESTNLSAADFYRESHGHVYRAILSLYAKGEPVDAITVVDELGKRGDARGGAAARSASTSSRRSCRRRRTRPTTRGIVREMATLRGLIRAGNDIARLGFDRPGETIELVDRAEQIVFDLSQQRVRREFAHVDELLKDSFETITKLYEAGQRHHRHAVGLPRPRPAHLRVPAGEPRHRRGAAVDGEVGARTLHGRECRRAARARRSRSSRSRCRRPR